MRRALFHLTAVLNSSKQKDARELKSTIKFLTKGSKPSRTLSKIIQKGISSDNNDEKLVFKSKPSRQEQEYINTILKVLNSTLPRKENNVQRVETHYQLFFNQLQKVLEQFGNDDGKKRPTKQIQNDILPITLNEVNYKEMNGEDLYNRLMLLQLLGKLTLMDTTKIILATNFDHFAKTIKNLSIFPIEHQLNLSLLLYYKLKVSKDSSNDSLITSLWQKYYSEWIDNFDKLHHSIRRILWRCLYMTDPNKINNIIQIKLKHWDINNLVTLYQSLFAHVYKLNLPEVIETTSQNNNNNNNTHRSQELFIKVIDLLSPFKSAYKNHMIKIVKLSIQSNLDGISQNNIHKIGNQYKFTTSLNLILQDIYNNSKILDTTLKQELEDIFTIIDRQENDLKTQLSLKFV
ncbi:MIOREX complex component 5 [Monosporozyma unispora]|nr:hypothetical protein C6P44_000166 [Kazachstania unispora]